MWIYRYLTDEKLWQVGYYLPEFGFVSMEAWKTQEEARKAVNYLNGGNPEVEINGSVGIIG